ncbi:MAG TPA: aldehyde ferredoxin oxidoreductase family protein [Candidatus Acidoferrales bacterium]|nr:aldehyde ferredoxin oxidoreductase family protein [Candidatus Acidoferrales bacterium]
MPNSYMGKILRVNLTNGKISTDTLADDVARKYIGGRGLSAKILFDELKPGIDPLGPENKMVVAAGPISAIPFSGNSRFSVCAKSPLGLGWGESYSGGYMAPKIKQSGFDAIIVEGVAKKPVWLLVNQGNAELRDAGKYWGKSTAETENGIKKDLGETDKRQSSVASIGQGGEKLVRYAAIMNDLREAVGRSGMGAVMGSKKLKAWVCKGNLKPPVHDSKKLNEYVRQCVSEVKKGPYIQPLRDYGTAGDTDDLSAGGRLPTKNFQRSTFEEGGAAKKITGEALVSTGFLTGRDTCWACSTNCKRVVESKSPYVIEKEVGGQEYETTAAFGSYCLNDDMYAIGRANQLCNLYGLDTISTGVVVGFAMEAYEKGIITKEMTGGLEVKWGSPDAVIKLVDMIGNREGIGDLLAEGVYRAAKKLGHGAEEFAVHVKGREVPMHEPRGKRNVGLMYAVGDRGACHMEWEHDDYWESDLYMRPELGMTADALGPNRTLLDYGLSKVKVAKIQGDLWSMCNSLVVCVFDIYPGGGIEHSTLLGILNAATGWNMSMEEYMQAGARAANLTRAFNAREGLGRKDDQLPKRIMEPLPDGLFAGKPFTQEILDSMLDNYYNLRGWDKKTGIPTRTTLDGLGLGYVAEELGKMNRLPG